MKGRYVVIVYNAIGGEPSTSIRKCVAMTDEENARMLADGFQAAYEKRRAADGLDGTAGIIVSVVTVTDA